MRVGERIAVEAGCALHEREQMRFVCGVGGAALEGEPLAAVHRQHKMIVLRLGLRVPRFADFLALEVQSETVGLLARVADRAVIQPHRAAMLALLLRVEREEFFRRLALRSAVGFLRRDQFHRLRAGVRFRGRCDTCLDRFSAALVFQSEKRGEIAGAIFFVRLPVHRIALAHFEAERALRFEAEDRIVAGGPLFVKGADVQVHSRQRAECADGIRAVEQHARGVTPFEARVFFQIERIGDGRSAILDARHAHVRGALALFRIGPGATEARVDVEHGVDRVRVVDVIRADERGVHRARLLAGEEMEQKTVRRLQIAERRLRLPILIADVRGKVRPVRRLGVARRIERMRPDVAEAARHTHAERPHEPRVFRDRWIVVVAVVRVFDALFPVCARLRRSVAFAEKVGIQKQSQPEDAAGKSVHRVIHAIAHREKFGHGVLEKLLVARLEKRGLLRDGLAEFGVVRLHPHIARVAGGRLGALRIAVPRWRREQMSATRVAFGQIGVRLRAIHRLIEIQAEDALRRIGIFLKARLIDQPRAHEAIATTTRIQRHKKIRDAIAILREPVPESFVATAPQQPGVASADCVALRVVNLPVAIRVEVQRLQRRVFPRGNHVHLPKQIARLRGETLRDARRDGRALHRPAAERLVHRLAAVRVRPEFQHLFQNDLLRGHRRRWLRRRRRLRARGMNRVREQNGAQPDAARRDGGEHPQAPA